MNAINSSMNRNEVFAAICAALGVTAKFENSGKNQRPSVGTGGYGQGFAHLLCNPKNIPAVVAIIETFGVDGIGYVPDKNFDGDTFLAFLYAASQTASCRDIRYGNGKHVSKDALKDNGQSVGYIAHCQLLMKGLLGKSTGSTKLLGKLVAGKDKPVGDQVVKAGNLLAARDAINASLNKKDSSKLGNAISKGDFDTVRKLSLIAPRSISKRHDKAVGE